MELIVVPSARFGGAALDALSRALAGIQRPCVGLPTGKTPVGLYRCISACRMAFPRGTRAFAVDEYIWADTTHPATNASFFRQHWRSGGGVPDVVVPRADAIHPEAEIEAHCRSIAAAGGFDVVLLGIGRNGHSAFNEPGSTIDSSCRVVPLAETTRRDSGWSWPHAPHLGMTVGLREIMAARRVVLLATGASKRAVLRDALTGPITDQLPASFLQRHAGLIVVCDAEAGWQT
ncbi:MAG: 6-phosphogluconolactonase [Dehalococcoidia bacterium]